MKITQSDIDRYKNKMVIYKISNTMNGKSYIGKCINGTVRVAAHFRDCKNPNSVGRCPKL
jgi:hypothetical protein